MAASPLEAPGERPDAVLDADFSNEAHVLEHTLVGLDALPD